MKMYNVSPYPTMGNTNTNTGRNLRIRQLIIIPTRGDYRKVYKRPYVVDANIDTINKFENLLSRNGNTHTIEPMILANSVPEVVKLSAMAAGAVDIPNGWDTQRGRFILEVESNWNNNITLSYIQGFTDYLDMSFSGYLPEDISMIINSITVIRKVYDVQTGMYRSLQSQTYNVIKDLSGRNAFREIDNMYNVSVLMRPVDVMNELYSGSTLRNMMGNNNLVINTSNIIGNNVGVSSRGNNDPMTYFSKTLNGFIDAKQSAAVGLEEDGIYRAATASPYIGEPLIIDNPFINALHHITNEIVPTTFRLIDLKRLDPNVENTTTVISKPDIPLGIMGTIDTENHLQPTQELLKATLVANTINSILINNMLSRLDVSIGNVNGPVPDIFPTNINSIIDGVDLQHEIGKVVSQIRTLLVPTLTDMGQTIVRVNVSTDIFNDTTICISLNLQPEVVFRFPTFADSLYSPVIGNNDMKNDVVQNFGNFMDATYNGYTPNGMI